MSYSDFVFYFAIFFRLALEFMASASGSVEHDETECSFCRELFTEPKLLPCGHLLCRHCLVDWMKTQQEARCPLCRCAIIEKEQRELQSLEDIADGFLTDLAMEELVEAQRLLNEGHDCCVCEDVAATALCLNCGDMLCEACKEAHGNLLMTQSHIVEDLSSLTAEKLVANRQSTCEAHPDKTTKLYCPTHGASICLLCASSKHRNCPEVKDLEEKAEEARAKLAELAATLSAKETELDRAISQLDQHLQDSEKQMQATIAGIESTCDRLESAIKARRRRLRELALKECSDVKVDAGKAGGMLQLRGKLAQHKRVIQRAEGMKSRHALRNMTSAMEKRVAKLDSSNTSPAVSTVSIVIAPEAVSSFERRLSALGTIRAVPFEPVTAVQKVGYRLIRLCEPVWPSGKALSW